MHKYISNITMQLDYQLDYQFMLILTVSDIVFWAVII